MAEQLFYQKPVALNEKRHGKVRIKAVPEDYRFAANTNSAILAGTEFVEASHEYPIVFAKHGEKLLPVALLGLRQDENLFVAADGSWLGRYIPAFIRRYPFILAGTDGEKMAVCIDEDYSGYDVEEGEPLFDEQGQPGEKLKKAMAFLQNYQVEFSRTDRFVEFLQKHELLKEMNAQVVTPENKRLVVQGVQVIDEEKLQQLDGEVVSKALRAGYLGWSYAHLISLGNLKNLSDQLKRRSAN